MSWCLTSRLPRVLAGLLVGASLAVAGAIMQAVDQQSAGLSRPARHQCRRRLRRGDGRSSRSMPTSSASHAWYAFAGAAVAAVAVYSVGSVGPRRRDAAETRACRRGPRLVPDLADHLRADLRRGHAGPDPPVVGRLAGRPAVVDLADDRALHPRRARRRLPVPAADHDAEPRTDIARSVGQNAAAMARARRRASWCCWPAAPWRWPDRSASSA